MSATELNDAPVLDQLRDHWQSICALIVWKLAKDGVKITHQDMEQFAKEDLVLLSHGHYDSFEFKMITKEKAELIAAHELTQRGHA